MKARGNTRASERGKREREGRVIMDKKTKRERKSEERKRKMITF